MFVMQMQIEIINFFFVRSAPNETRNERPSNKQIFICHINIDWNVFFCLVLGLVCAKMKLLLQIADTIEAPGKFSETRLCFGTGFQKPTHI